jgi:hypothetical protein
VLLEKAYPLLLEHRFPLTLGLEPNSQTGESMRVEVTAFIEAGRARAQLSRSTV